MGVPVLIGIYWMQCIEFGLSFCSDMVTGMVAYRSVEGNRIVRLIMVLKKTDKNHSGQLELLASIYE